jgi:hypothetical protein
MDIVLIADMLDYVMKHFEADDDETAERFDQACTSLQTKMRAAAIDAGLRDSAEISFDTMPTMHTLH